MYLGALGYAGEHWEAHWAADYGATLLTEARWDGQAEEAALDRQLHGWRHVVEDVNGVLTVLLGLAFPKARRWWGLLTRLAAKVAACNLLLRLNQDHARPPFAHLNPMTL